jgi:ubiquinone/menaquinone biosynthesis C-methylase UbiE
MDRYHAQMKDELSHPVREEYARLAGRYDRRWARYLDRSIARTLAHVRPVRHESLIDVGCGTGRLLAGLLRRQAAGDLIGVDLSPEMLSVARTRLEGRVQLVEASADELPFDDGRFDWLVCSSVFHYLPDPEATLAEWRRVLRPGGQLVLTDWCSDFLSMRLLDRLLRRFTRAHVHTWSADELERMVRSAGFGMRERVVGRITPIWGLATLVADRSEGA